MDSKKEDTSMEAGREAIDTKIKHMDGGLTGAGTTVGDHPMTCDLGSNIELFTLKDVLDAIQRTDDKIEALCTKVDVQNEMLVRLRNDFNERKGKEVPTVPKGEMHPKHDTQVKVEPHFDSATNESHMSHPVTRSRRKALDEVQKFEMDALAINLDSSEDEEHTEHPLRDPLPVQPTTGTKLATKATDVVAPCGSPAIGKTFTLSTDFGGNLKHPSIEPMTQAHHLVAGYSELRGGSNLKDDGDMNKPNKAAHIGRRLSYTPSSTERPIKIPKVDNIDTKEEVTTKTADKGKGTIEGTFCPSQSKRNVSWTRDGQVLPGFMKCNFKPSADMGLSHTQLQMCAYVFHPEREQRENIFSGGGINATREEFQCLCPGEKVTEKIITMFCYKLTWFQRHVKTPDVWCLPPSFARDILSGHSTTEIKTKYSDQWMPIIRDLKFIYVPIKDNNSHWFLIVLNIEEHKIFHLDSPLAEVSPAREDVVMTVVDVLGQIIFSGGFHEKFTKGIGDMLTWPATVRGGLRNTTDNSAVWVLSWIDMEYAFNPKLVAVMNEKKVRMKAAMDLLIGGHNECWISVESRAVSNMIWARK
ncbi:Ulp1 protease family, C-terminal catalytic domain [Sesbania bispinosa]|nr:Ulp1 protease family, C-terminal catalytic domain [Sesbania bispinosa]